MKSQEITKIIAAEFNLPATAGLSEINKVLKEKGATIKFRITGEKLGYLGHTVPLKNVTDEGIKVITVSKVMLIRFADIATFHKAKPKEPRKVYPKTVEERADVPGKKGKDDRITAKKKKFFKDDDEDDDDIDFDEDDFADEVAPIKRSKRRATKTGSSFIPEKGRVKGKLR